MPQGSELGSSQVTPRERLGINVDRPDTVNQKPLIRETQLRQINNTTLESSTNRNQRPANAREKLFDKAFLAQLNRKTIPDNLELMQVRARREPEPKAGPADTIPTVDDINDDGLDYRSNATLLVRIARSKIGRAFLGVIGLIGIGKSGQAGGEFLENSIKYAETREEIHDEIVPSIIERAHNHGLAFNHLTDMNEVVALDGEEPLRRSELLTMLSKEWTKQLLNPDATGLSEGDTDFNRTRAKGLFNIIEENIGFYYSDGEKILDIRKVFDAYGDQLRMHNDEDFPEMLSAITGYSSENLKTHAEIMRHSALEAPDIRMGFYGMYEYDIDKYSSVYNEHRAEHIKERYDFADQFSMEILEALNVDNHPELRPEAARIVKDAIKAIIHLDNQWTQVGTSLENWNTYEIVRNGFIKDSHAYYGDKIIKAGIEQFYDAEQDVELSLKKLGALEKDPNGSIHKMVEALLKAQEEKAKKIFSQATNLGEEAEACFAKELARYDD